ncbi:MAG: hypothetical protein AB7H71_11700 [Alphaproteobacteria bacterium]
MCELEKSVARELLARGGIGVIWDAHVAAEAAYRVGNVRAAHILLNIADAAETIWRDKGPSDTPLTRSRTLPT